MSAVHVYNSNTLFRFTHSYSIIINNFCIAENQEKEQKEVTFPDDEVLNLEPISLNEVININFYFQFRN